MRKLQSRVLSNGLEIFPGRLELFFSKASEACETCSLTLPKRKPRPPIHAPLAAHSLDREHCCSLALYLLYSKERRAVRTWATSLLMSRLMEVEPEIVQCKREKEAKNVNVTDNHHVPFVRSLLIARAVLLFVLNVIRPFVIRIVSLLITCVEMNNFENLRKSRENSPICLQIVTKLRCLLLFHAFSSQASALSSQFSAEIEFQ